MTEFDPSNPVESTAVPETTTDPAATAVPWRQRFLMLGVAALVIIIDQTTKYLVERNLPLNTSWAPIESLAPIFQFTHVANTGATFGLFAGGGTIFMLVAFVVSIGLLIYNYTLPPGHISLRIALGLVLGGAVGNNLLDRFRLGHVTDFFDIGPWYIFNVADMAIVGGVILLGWLTLQDARLEQAAARAGAPEQANDA